MDSDGLFDCQTYRKKTNLHPLNKKHRIPFQRFSWSLRAIPEARTMIGCLLAPLRSCHGTGSPWLGGGGLSCAKDQGSTQGRVTQQILVNFNLYIHMYIYICISFAKKWNLCIYIYIHRKSHSILECMYGKTLETSI